MKKRKIKQLPLPNQFTVMGVPIKLRYFSMLALMILFIALVFAFLPSDEKSESYTAKRGLDALPIQTKVLYRKADKTGLEPYMLPTQKEQAKEDGDAGDKAVETAQDQTEENANITPASEQSQAVLEEPKTFNIDGNVTFFNKSGETDVYVWIDEHTTVDNYSLFVMPKIKPDQVVTTATVQPGDNLVDFLTRHHLNLTQSYNVIEAFKKVYNPRSVKAGDIFKLELKREENEDFMRLVELKYQPTFYEEIVVKKDGDGYKASKDKKELVQKELGASFTVDSSLYVSAVKAGLPDSLIMDLIYIYSWKVDFQRDIRQGDKITVFYDAQFTEEGVATNNYNILYASMMASGSKVEIYRYKDSSGDVDFFTNDGKSVREGLLKTPIAFGRVSSGYGMRKHPVLGYTKMHKGVDFAAPRGTKIYAAADGVIEKKYYSSSYGNYIRIRHASGIKTAYAHMKGFARGMKNGKKVKQGQVIGYVGTTGRSTGPHLHYEVLKGGRQVNPRSVDLPTQNILTGSEKKKFEKAVKEIENRARLVLTDFDIQVPVEVAKSTKPDLKN